MRSWKGCGGYREWLTRSGSFLILMAIMMSGCSNRVAATHDDAAAGSVSGPKTLAEAELLFGVAPTRNAQVVYQPDVIIPAGGAQSVRSVSTNGLTWTIDANAAGASDLALGKIMFLTGRAVGRVLQIVHTGDDLALTLGPVELTDVIRQAHLTGSQTIVPDVMHTYSAPDWPGSEGEPVAFAPADAAPRPIAELIPVFANYVTPELAQVSPPQLGAAQVSVHKLMAVNPFLGGGLGASYSLPVMNYGTAPVRAQGNFLLYMSNPFVTWDINITTGGLETAKLQVHNAAGLKLHFEASSNKQFTPGDNKKDLVFVPMDLSFPLGGPVPLSLVIHQTIMLQTAFTAKASVLMGTGDYGFDGMLTLECHYGSCRSSAPGGFVVKQSVLDSLAANTPSLGVNGIIVTYEGRVIVGLGGFGFVTGPYIGFGVSVGATRGSDTSDFITTPCRQADMAVWTKAGVGYAMPAVVAKIINVFLNVINVAPIKAVGGPAISTGVVLPGTPPGHSRVGCGSG